MTRRRRQLTLWAVLLVGVGGLVHWWLASRRGATELVNAPPPAGPVVCFGDSLVEGVGAGGSDHTYPAQLARLLGREVLNLGHRGDTTADAVPKSRYFRDKKLGIVVVTLGGNDILRQVEWPETDRNLREIFANVQAGGAVVVFTGVNGPVDISRTRRYAAICRDLGVLFIPDILDDILSDPELKSDEIHPNAAGYRLMAERVAKALRRARLVD